MPPEAGEFPEAGLALLHARLRLAPKSGALGRRRFADWLEDPVLAHERHILTQPAVEALLRGIAEASPFLWRIMERDPAQVITLLLAPPELALKDCCAQTLACGEIATQPECMRRLRLLRARVALLIALCDLGGVFDTVAVTAALSQFADVSLRAALRFCLRGAIAAGSFTPVALGTPEAELGLFVLALGKHGAGELNYSSDIDLAIFYEAEAPCLSRLEDAGAFAIGLVKGIVKLLSERTADGFVHRVDLRLRPDPGLTPIAMPCHAAMNYYESVGQNWERAAMIKARPVAGDLAAGARFLKGLEPFIWRKYFDYAAIADIHAMKRQIYAVKGHDEIAIAGHDLKVGRGGIREIEFFVQTQQLVYGGRRPSLRGARTLDMLAELAREGWVSTKAAAALHQAYCALRDLEHRVQMLNDEQTQKLPKSEEALTLFARFCGLTRRSFETHLVRQLKTVEAHYALLFERVPGLASKAGSLVFTGVEDDPETLETLARLGFKQPSRAAETIRGWHFGRRPAIMTPRAREILTELLPGLLEAFGESSDPDGALHALDSALERLPAIGELFSILKNNAELRRLFAECLGTAPRLSQIVAQTPHVLDVLIDPDFVRGGLADTAPRIATRLARESDFEAFLERARELSRAERFLLGTRVLSRILPLSEAGAAHTAIAEAFLAPVLARVRSEFARAHGGIVGSQMLLLGYGKAGSREMNAGSDLDLVVIYDAPADMPSDGARPLFAAEYFARLTQRLISALSVPMRAGRLYEIDLRLRPSGRKGTVATSLAGFADYQKSEAETWEHLALSRARVLAGDAGLAARLGGVIGSLLSERRDPRKIQREIAAMRALMAHEKPGADRFDVKDWPGGLVDCEFAAQALVLLNAASHSGLLGKGTQETLIEAERLAILPAKAGNALTEAWRLQTDFLQMTRLCLDAPFNEAEASAIFKQKLANRLDFPDFKQFSVELADRQRKARLALESVVGKIAPV